MKRHHTEILTQMHPGDRWNVRYFPCLMIDVTQLVEGCMAVSIWGPALEVAPLNLIQIM